MRDLQVGDRVKTTDIPFEEGVVVQIVPISSDRNKVIVFLDSERLFYGYDEDFEVLNSSFVEVFVEDV